MNAQANSKGKLKTAFKNEKWRWILYVFLPAFLLVTFLILLMHCVDFNNEMTSSSTQTSTLEEAQAFHEKFVSTINPIIAVPLNCTEKYSNTCHLYCTGNIGSSLKAFLTTQYNKCNGSLDLRLENCNFPDRTITPHLFDGIYRLKTFTVTDCDFTNIASDTFKQLSFIELTELYFYSNSIEQLSFETFIGLSSLKMFEMENNETLFKGNGFLEPLAKTLEVIKIRQHTTAKQFDPKDWFGNVEFTKVLSVNLDGNFFPTILGSETFQKFKSVQNLSLQNCSITQVGVGTFESIARTLKYLDLRKNNLKHLNVNFVAKTAAHILRLELAENPWSCGCDNYDLVAIVQGNQVEYTVTPKCASPPEWSNTDMNCSCIDCTEQTIETTASDKTTIEIDTTTDEEIITEEDTTTEKEKTTEEQITTDSEICTTIIEGTSTPSTTESTPHPTASFTCSTSTTTTTTTPEPPPPREYIKCIGVKGNTFIPFYESKVFFIIETLTPTSVNVSIKNVPEHLTLLYFNQKYSGRKYCDHNCLVANLIAMECYTFCLIPNKAISTSAFSCHSHQLNLRDETPVTSTDGNDNKALFWTIFVFGILLCIFIGGVIIFFVLRWRPIWLRGNKRLVRTSPTSQTVFLYSKPRKKEEQTERTNHTPTSHQSSLHSETSSYANFSRNSLSSRVEVPSSSQVSQLPAFYENIE